MQRPTFRRLLTATALACALAAPGTAQTEDLLGANFASGTTYRVDSTDASVVTLGTTGFPNMGAMAKDALGTVWAHTNFERKLLTLDPATGLGTEVASTFLTVRGMDFVGGALYAIGDGGFGNDDRLYVLNTLDGTSTLIGNTDHERIEAFAVVGGQAYAWDQSAGLLTVNLANGQTINVSGANDGGFDVQTLALSPSGTLYGAWENLYTIDTATGAHTLVDDLLGFADLDAMTFYPYADCLGLEVANLQAGQVATVRTTGAPDGTFVVLTFGVQQGSTPIFVPPAFCAEFGLANLTAANVLASGPIAAGAFEVAAPVPAALVGLTLYLQSAQVGSCPTACMSRIKAKVL